MNRGIAVLMALLLAVPCAAAVLVVDPSGAGDYETIQEAINNSQDGDTIVVKPGTYAEQVGFNSRRVTVRSEDPSDPAVVEATVIAVDSGHGVYFDFGEGSDSVLEGFTITGYGVFCSATSPTISGNVIRDCADAGISGESGAAPTIVGNTITGCAQEGIYGCDGLIQGNTISANDGGIAYCQGTIQDNTITDNAQEGVYACNGLIEGNTIARNLAGLSNCGGRIEGNRVTDNGGAGGMYYCDGQIVGNVIVGNTASSSGGGLFSCQGSILNNVIAGNQAHGGGGGLYDCSQSVCNNTIVGNVATGRGGGLSHCAGTVCNNIIAYNEADSAGGLYGTSNNTYNAFWTNDGGNFGGEASSGSGDIVANPQFAVEGFWDGDVWTDGDYHLKSQAGRWDAEAKQWVVDDVASPCIDAGSPASDFSAELWPHGQRINLGAYGGTSQASWSLSDGGDIADLNHNGIVGPDDLEIIAGQWLVLEDLLAEDLNRDGSVDAADLVLLGQSWRSEPPAGSAPSPNPMTWATEPYGTGPYSMAMVATAAVSTDGTGVEYYFENPLNADMNSGWLSFAEGEEPRWEVSELSAYTTYWFRVKARNRGNLWETEWSDRASGSTQREDLAEPRPSPMTWETEPYGSSADTIYMVATAASDDSGVEYYFECTSDSTYSSEWQDSRVYEITSVPQGRYTFIVRARDKSAYQNTTYASVPATADLLPPTPDPMEWEIEPYEVKLGNDLQYGATMTAVEADDDYDDVEYYFQCTTESAFSSGWQTSPEYTIIVGRRGQKHRFRVKARDTSTSYNETGWSSEVVSE